MKALKKIFILFTIFIVCFSVYVVADQDTTTMTWYVPSARSHSVAYGGNCNANQFFFPEGSAVLDNDIDGNAAQILPQEDRAATAACQADDTAGMEITNSGTASTNIDANFEAAGDANTWLKIWMGTGSGCGTAGLGGWEMLCSSNTVTTPVFMTECKDFNSGNATTGTRIITALAKGDTNQLCFSGEFRANTEDWTYSASVAAGDHNRLWQSSTDFS